jgi:hypothetical protein
VHCILLVISSQKQLYSFSSSSLKMVAHVSVMTIWKCCTIRKVSKQNVMVFVIYLYLALSAVSIVLNIS